MPDQPEALERLTLRAAWVGLEDVPIVFANQIIGQLDDKGEAILTFGQATPPVLLGTPEEQQQQASLTHFVQIRPVARLTLSGARMEELITVLQKTLENQRMVVQQLAQENPG